MPGGSKLIEALVSSPICQNEGGGMAMIGQNGAVEFGIDPDEDPELALALRVSLEEQRQRQRAEGGGEEQDIAMDVQQGEQRTSSERIQPANEVNLAAMTEEEQLEWALQMSMAQDAEEAKSTSSKLYSTFKICF